MKCKCFGGEDLNEFVMTNEEMQNIIGEENTMYYMLSFDYYRENPRSLRPRFNSGAFLGGIFWLAYRKMYLMAVIMMIISIALNSFLKLILPYDIGVGIVYLFLSMYGERIYYEHSKIKCLKVKSKLREGEDFYEKLKKHGGTNKLIVFLVVMLVGYFMVYRPISHLNGIMNELYRKLWY